MSACLCAVETTVSKHVHCLFCRPTWSTNDDDADEEDVDDDKEQLNPYLHFSSVHCRQ